MMIQMKGELEEGVELQIAEHAAQWPVGQPNSVDCFVNGLCNGALFCSALNTQGIGMTWYLQLG